MRHSTPPPILAYVLWPNGCTDQDATRQGVGLGPGHIVLHGDPAPPKKGHSSPQFSPYVCCGQTARWTKMPLGMEVGLGPGHIVLHGDPPLQKGHSPPMFSPCLLWPNGWMDQDTTWYGGINVGPSDTVLDGDPAPHKGAQPRNFWPMPVGREVGRGPGDIVLDGDPTDGKSGTAPPPPLLGPCLLWPKGWMDQDATWYGGSPRPRPRCVRWVPAPLPPEMGIAATLFSAHVYCDQTVANLSYS